MISPGKAGKFALSTSAEHSLTGHGCKSKKFLLHLHCVFCLQKFWSAAEKISAIKSLFKKR